MWLVDAGAAYADESPRRARPDYDGRGNQDAHGGHWALWVPRVLLFPFYVVNEYVLRRPLGWIVTKGEREHWLDAPIENFKFGPQHDYLLVPTALVDFGLLPSAGLYFSGQNMVHADNQVVLNFSTGGVKYLTATALDRYSWDQKRSSVTTRIDFRREVDLLYMGTGPDVTDRTRSRYGIEYLDSHASYKRYMFGESTLAIAAGARTVEFRNGDCCHDPTLEDRITAGDLPTPPGYRAPYAPVYQRVEIALDSRRSRPAPGTGVYLKLHERVDLDLRSNRRWTGYGGVLGGAIDLDREQRTLRLQLGVDYTDPIRGEVPFHELAQLGSDMMPGFIGGWMRGRSTAVAQLAYTWPVSVWADGQIRLATGNAFDAHLRGFALGKLRGSADVGLTTIDARDSGFEALAGVGTETFEHGATITSLRLTVGARVGF